MCISPLPLKAKSLGLDEAFPCVMMNGALAAYIDGDTGAVRGGVPIYRCPLRREEAVAVRQVAGSGFRVQGSKP